MMGRDGQDPLFLQAKEAEASVLEPYVGESEFGNHGERVVEGQWLMQAASDILLGWLPALGIDGAKARLLRAPTLGRQAIGRRRHPAAGGAGDLRAGLRLDLARAHARSGDRIAIGSYLGKGETFDGRSPSSQSATPTRTSSTTALWPTPPSRAASRWRRTSSSRRARRRRDPIAGRPLD